MTDPWKDMRHVPDIPVANAEGLQLEFERLLTDADALLAAVREELLMLRKHHYESSDFSSFAEWLNKNRPNFAALPEHLRGDIK